MYFSGESVFIAVKEHFSSILGSPVLISKRELIAFLQVSYCQYIAFSRNPPVQTECFKGSGNCVCRNMEFGSRSCFGRTYERRPKCCQQNFCFFFRIKSIGSAAPGPWPRSDCRSIFAFILGQLVVIVRVLQLSFLEDKNLISIIYLKYIFLRQNCLGAELTI